MEVWGVVLVACVCVGVRGVVLCRCVCVCVCVCVWPVDLFTGSRCFVDVWKGSQQGGTVKARGYINSRGYINYCAVV